VDYFVTSACLAELYKNSKTKKTAHSLQLLEGIRSPAVLQSANMHTHQKRPGWTSTGGDNTCLDKLEQVSSHLQKDEVILWTRVVLIHGKCLSDASDASGA